MANWNRASTLNWSGAFLLETNDIGIKNGAQIAMSADGSAIVQWTQSESPLGLGLTIGQIGFGVYPDLVGSHFN